MVRLHAPGSMRLRPMSITAVKAPNIPKTAPDAPAETTPGWVARLARPPTKPDTK